MVRMIENFDRRTDITAHETAQTIPGLFRERVARNPDAIACREWNSIWGQWRDYSWSEIARLVVRYQAPDLPEHAQIRAVHLVLEPWTVQQGLLTPTLKVKRQAITQRYSAEIDALYASLKDGRESLAQVRISPLRAQDSREGRRRQQWRAIDHA